MPRALPMTFRNIALDLIMPWHTLALCCCAKLPRSKSRVFLIPSPPLPPACGPLGARPCPVHTRWQTPRSLSLTVPMGLFGNQCSRGWASGARLLLRVGVSGLPSRMGPGISAPLHEPSSRGCNCGGPQLLRLSVLGPLGGAPCAVLSCGWASKDAAVGVRHLGALGPMKAVAEWQALFMRN